MGAGGSYLSAEVQLEYFIDPDDWAIHKINVKTVLFQIIQFSMSTQFRCREAVDVFYSPSWLGNYIGEACYAEKSKEQL